MLGSRPATAYLDLTGARYLDAYGAPRDRAEQTMAEQLARLLETSRAEDADGLLEEANAFVSGAHPNPTARRCARRLAGRLLRLAMREGELPSRTDAQLACRIEAHLQTTPQAAAGDLRRWIEYRRRQGRKLRQLEGEARILSGFEVVAGDAAGLEPEALVVRWQQALAPSGSRHLGAGQIAARTRLVQRYLRFTRRV